MKIVILLENRTNRGGIKAEHGLSLYIETEQNGKILSLIFDLGPSRAMVENANRLGVDLSKPEHIVISHGHSDHGGVLPEILDFLNEDLTLHIQKRALEKSYYKLRKSDTYKESSIYWNLDGIDEDRIRVNYTDEPFWISENIVVSGTIKGKRGEPTERFYKKSGEAYVVDAMDHEQFLAIRENDKVYLFSGCSHLGVPSAISYAKELMDTDEIELLIGGFHTYRSSRDEVSRLAQELGKMKIKTIAPMHCTGLEASFVLKKEFGDSCLLLGTGDVYET